MIPSQSICLLNDSFPPLIDGVANAVVNYAEILSHNGKNPIVITPSHPQADDKTFSYPVIRYPSFNFHKMDGYVAGLPFSPEVARKLNGETIDLFHTHCPIISTFMARELREIKDAPIVLTYHTKFDIDIENLVSSHRVQNACKKALVANINACDEVWVVSNGAGENLRSLGYEGEYVIMPNGVDIPRKRATESQISNATSSYNLPANIPVYLFVGRMMWYKGIRLILDALTQLRKTGLDFRMIFIGDGADRKEIEAYTHSCGLSSNCIFTGSIQNREHLRAWYTKADLFLFPSTFDTNGLVVREAAACDLASVLIRDSCAAEGVTDGKNGFLIEESAEALFTCLSQLYQNRSKIRDVGVGAGNDLYISWLDAVTIAEERYAVVMDRYKSGNYPQKRHPMDGMIKLNGELMEALGKIFQYRRNNKLF